MRAVIFDIDGTLADLTYRLHYVTGGQLWYIVIDRPMAEKRRDAGWRADIKDKDGQPFDLLAKHAQTFASQIKDIWAGDNLPCGVHVLDLRPGMGLA